MRTLALGLALCCATPAAARTPKFSRPDPTVTVKLSDRVRPMLPSGLLPEPAIGSAELEVLLGTPIGPPDAQLLAKLEATAVDQLLPADRARLYFDRASEH